MSFSLDLGILSSPPDLQWSCRAKCTKSGESHPLAPHPAWFWWNPWVRQKCELLIRALGHSWFSNLHETRPTGLVKCRCRCEHNLWLQLLQFPKFLIRFPSHWFWWRGWKFGIPWLCLHSTAEQSRCSLKFQLCSGNGNPGFYLVLQIPISTASNSFFSSILHLLGVGHRFWFYGKRGIEEKKMKRKKGSPWIPLIPPGKVWAGHKNFLFWRLGGI